MKTGAAAVVLAILVAGCNITRSSVVLVGEKRAAIAPSAVRIYADPPANFSKIAILSSSSGNDFASEQSLTDSVMERLKEEAAKLGANGVLLQSVGDKDLGSSGTAVAMPNSGLVVGSSAVRTGKQASALAIYVPEE